MKMPTPRSPAAELAEKYGADPTMPTAVYPGFALLVSHQGFIEVWLKPNIYQDGCRRIGYLHPVGEGLYRTSMELRSWVNHELDDTRVLGGEDRTLENILALLRETRDL